MVKWQIIELWQAGVKNKSEIARRLRLSWTAVNLWVQRWESEGHLNVRPRSGRPRSTSGDDETTVNTHMAFYGVSTKPLQPIKIERLGPTHLNNSHQGPCKEAAETKRDVNDRPFSCDQPDDKITGFPEDPPPDQTLLGADATATND